MGREFRRVLFRSDKIFLLSQKEVTTEGYGFNATYDYSDIARKRTVSDYARATGAYMYKGSGDCQYIGYWWLRSPSFNYSHFALSVYYRGGACNQDNVSRTDYGVVPALSID